MKAHEHKAFWELYHSVSRPAIQRACERASKTLSDGTMDPDAMVSWADSRVWQLLESDGWPTFHDDPTPEEAANRLARNAKTVARWAYLALCRKHWRRRSKRVDLSPQDAEQMGRVERMSATKGSAETQPEGREEIDRKLAELRDTVSATLRARIAASWPEPSERGRIAMALGVDDEEGQELMDKVESGTMKKNTVQQMRSRSLRAAQQIVDAAKRSAGAIAIALVVGLMTLGAPDASAAPEQTGGRGGMSVGPDVMVTEVVGRPEQSGGRGGKKP